MIILAGLVALFLALFQYRYRFALSRIWAIPLIFLRFIALMMLFLLLINPRVSKESYTLEPPNLVVLSDNSSSLQEGNAAAQLEESLRQIKNHPALKERFRVYSYSFGSALNRSDSLSFNEKATNTSEALASLNEIYSQTNTAIVLLSDGNQTLGRDYEYMSAGQGLPVYPVALGDSTRYEDLRIDQVISNTYAFLNNQFPLETYISYEGPSTIRALLTITVDGARVAQQRVQLSPQQRSTTLHTLLKASEVGTRKIELALAPLENERNTSNNRRTLAVEVVDEQTTVAMVSELRHPDLGALEKAIESNEQRRVITLSPDAPAAAWAGVDIFFLYQPGSSFSRLYSYIERAGAGTFTITGPKTHWSYLNAAQKSFQKETSGQVEEILPIVNPAFALFDISGLDLQDYPPLEGELGDILITQPHEVLLEQRIRGVDMDEPLLALMSGGARKEAVLFGENLWKWRMQCYRNTGNFENFDALIGKIILYLSNTGANQRFTIDYNPVYQGTEQARIRAAFFDETFELETNASLLLNVNNKDNALAREVPMLLKGPYFESDLSDLPPGDYTFTVRVEGENFSGSGSFNILDFDVEKQLLATNYRKLGRFADKTGGALYFPSETDQLIQDLATSDRYLPLQKSKQIVVSLIDYQWLLVIIATALAGEWFIRKYNGLN